MENYRHCYKRNNQKSVLIKIRDSELEFALESDSYFQILWIQSPKTGVKVGFVFFKSVELESGVKSKKSGVKSLSRIYIFNLVELIRKNLNR